MGACQTGSKENQSETSAVTEADVRSVAEQNENFLFSGCFQLVESEGENKAVTFISLGIEGSEVSGEQAIEMTGPAYNAVATGNFEGKLEEGIITVIYEFEIEGSEQKEEQEFKLTEKGLQMTNSPLEEMNGIMMLKQKGLFNKVIPKIDCP